LALSGHDAMADLSPLCAQKLTFRSEVAMSESGPVPDLGQKGAARPGVADFLSEVAIVMC